MNSLSKNTMNTHLRTDLVPPGAPSWITSELIAETIRVWQPKYQKPLSPDDAVEILVNVGRLLEIIQVTDRR